MFLRGRPPASQSIEVIRRALDRGVRLIETADSYCVDESDDHHNESLIRRAPAAWMRSKPPALVPIPGASQLQSMHDSLSAADLALTDDEIEAIDNDLV